MRRIQFYPGDELHGRLNQKAADLGISVSQLVKDILESVDLSSAINSSSQNFYSLFNSVKASVQEFVVSSPKEEFVLREAVSGWGSIPQTGVAKSVSALIPNPIKASLGTAFAAKVKAGKIPHVCVAKRMDKNGIEVSKLDKYGTMLYKNMFAINKKKSP